MDLIYYYPHKYDPPSMVGRTVLSYLLKREAELPFEHIKLFTSKRYVEEAKKRLNIDVMTWKDLKNISRRDIIHIPISPIIMPNYKFLLHLFALLKQIKLILQCHGEMRMETKIKIKYQHSLDIQYLPTYIFAPYLLKSADLLITHSYMMQDYIKKYGVKNVVVIPNGIDDFWFEDSNVDLELEGISIFYHGRLSPEKGIEILLRGFGESLDNNVKLYIAGRGSQEEYLFRLCRKIGIEKRVIFLGWLNRDKIRAYLNNVTAAIYPSLWDNFPLTYLEAFSSANCPVYFSRRAGIFDFVRREGYVLNAFEPSIENISKIINEITNERYDRKVVTLQREFARGYSWDLIINNYIKLYKDMSNV
jgi:glycosyltransferase involved in cell wall biosynthesis